MDQEKVEKVEEEDKTKEEEQWAGRGERGALATKRPRESSTPRKQQW